MENFDFKDLFISIGLAWTEWLTNLGLAPEWVSFINTLVGAILITFIPVIIVVFTIMGERKIIGRFQDRLGPNRVGPFGFFQTIPDVVKLLTKEIITPDTVDKVLYNIAPMLSVVAVILIWAVMPLCKQCDRGRIWGSASSTLWRSVPWVRWRSSLPVGPLITSTPW